MSPSNYRVLFRCDGASLPEIGTGHVVRDIAIANGLVKSKSCQSSEVGFVIRSHGPYRVGHRLVERSGYTVIPTRDQDLKWNSEKEACVLANLKTFVLIVDRLATEAGWMVKVRRRSRHVVTLDDVGTGAPKADVVINGIVHGLAPGKDRYLGFDYLFLANPVSLSPKVTNGRVERIVTSFGGHDERNLTEFVLESLIRKPLNRSRPLQSLDLMVGEGSSKMLIDLRKKISVLSSKDWREVRLLVQDANYYQRLANADLAIVSGGLTIFEALGAGVPVIGLPQYPHQLETLDRLVDHRVVKLGSKQMTLDQDHFRMVFDNILGSKEVRTSLSHNGKALVDGNGNKRVLDVLMPLLSLST